MRQRSQGHSSAVHAHRFFHKSGKQFSFNTYKTGMVVWCLGGWTGRLSKFLWLFLKTLLPVSCSADERGEKGSGVRQPTGHPAEISGGNSG